MESRPKRTAAAAATEILQGHNSAPKNELVSTANSLKWLTQDWIHSLVGKKAERSGPIYQSVAVGRNLGFTVTTDSNLPLVGAWIQSKVLKTWYQCEVRFVAEAVFDYRCSCKCKYV